MLYLFDGYNILHAGSFRDRSQLIDALAGFVAQRGARGIVVFDGTGDDAVIGPLEVRFATPADPLIERLAAEHRAGEDVAVVSSDRAVRGTVGQETRRVSSRTFLRELADERRGRPAAARSPLEERLDPATRDALDRFRRRRHFR